MTLRVVADRSLCAYFLIWSGLPGVTGLVPGNYIAPENHLETMFKGSVAGEGRPVPMLSMINEGDGQ